MPEARIAASTVAPSSSITRCRYCFSGSAYTTSTVILCDTVNLFGAGRERLNHIRGQLFKDAAKRQLNQFIGKLKVQLELDATGISAEGGKLPATHQGFKRTIYQMHQNTLIARQRIAGGERLADPRFGDIDRRRHLRRARLQHSAPGTSRNKLWIRLNVVH
ncbi:hypothetical protein EcWSU1_03428 [Enterobacter ludwigii]|uniref:Uncharacterized protein n=1 Tax=Enterobacter ludwigii TaxID=299767 RepID=G8LNX2_9ENTR|nr:hypothetical protein EcWSU1_03428 [Enterobacter ludwigii]